MWFVGGPSGSEGGQGVVFDFTKETFGVFSVFEAMKKGTDGGFKI